MRKSKTVVKPPPTGRPSGSTIYDKDTFINKSTAIYMKFLKRRKKPTQHDVAAKLGISRATFCRYLVNYSSWVDIHNDAQAALE